MRGKILHFSLSHWGVAVMPVFKAFPVWKRDHAASSVWTVEQELPLSTKWVGEEVLTEVTCLLFYIMHEYVSVWKENLEICLLDHKMITPEEWPCYLGAAFFSSSYNICMFNFQIHCSYFFWASFSGCPAMQWCPTSVWVLPCSCLPSEHKETASSFKPVPLLQLQSGSIHRL